MGGFFLVCAGPHDNRQDEVAGLQVAFAELGFAAPEIVKAEEYVFAAYPKFQSRSAGVKRYPNGDFAFVCGTSLSEGIGLAPAALLYQTAAATSQPSEQIMGSLCRCHKEEWPDRDQARRVWRLPHFL